MWLTNISRDLYVSLVIEPTILNAISQQYVYFSSRQSKAYSNLY